MSRRRKARVALARQVAMYIIREEFEWSYLGIGKVLGRDHVTVLYAWRKVSRIAAYKPEFSEEVGKIRLRWREQCAAAHK